MSRYMTRPSVLAQLFIVFNALSTLSVMLVANPVSGAQTRANKSNTLSVSSYAVAPDSGWHNPWISPSLVLSLGGGDKKDSGIVLDVRRHRRLPGYAGIESLVEGFHSKLAFTVSPDGIWSAWREPPYIYCRSRLTQKEYRWYDGDDLTSSQLYWLRDSKKVVSLHFAPDTKRLSRALIFSVSKLGRPWRVWKVEERGTSRHWDSTSEPEVIASGKIWTVSVPYEPRASVAISICDLANRRLHRIHILRAPRGYRIMPDVPPSYMSAISLSPSGRFAILGCYRMEGNVCAIREYAMWVVEVGRHRSWLLGTVKLSERVPTKGFSDEPYNIRWSPAERYISYMFRGRMWVIAAIR